MLMNLRLAGIAVPEEEKGREDGGELAGTDFKGQEEPDSSASQEPSLGRDKEAVYHSRPAEIPSVAQMQMQPLAQGWVLTYICRC